MRICMEIFHIIQIHSHFRLLRCVYIMCVCVDAYIICVLYWSCFIACNNITCPYVAICPDHGLEVYSGYNNII